MNGCPHIHRKRATPAFANRPVEMWATLARQRPSEIYRTDVALSVFDQYGLHVYCSVGTDQVEFVEAFLVNDAKVVFEGLEVLGVAAGEVVAAIAATHELVEEEAGSSYLVKSLDIALWRSGKDCAKFESFGVGGIGYYDKIV